MLLRWSGWELINPGSSNSLLLSLKLVKKIDFPSDIFIFSLFGVYSFSIAPLLTDFLKYGEKNYFVGITGLAVYILEAFAFDYKLYMIRFRSELKKLEVQNDEGERHLIPRAGPMLWVGLFFRIAFRVGIIAISVYAFGLKEHKDVIFFSMLGSFILEAIIFAYTCMKTNLFNQTPTTREEFFLEWKKDGEWLEQQQKTNATKNIFWNELATDIVLHLYAFMLYTAWWDMVNEEGINMVRRNFESGTGIIFGFIAPMPMLFSMTLLAMMPLRLAYWIEDSAMSFTPKDRRKTRASFFLAALITISPVIIELFKLYFPK